MCVCSVTKLVEKMDRDEALVKLVEQECVIWKRNHPLFKNVGAKEQAWNRVAFQLGISSESFFSLSLHTHNLKRRNLPESKHDDSTLIQLFDNCTLIHCKKVMKNM